MNREVFASKATDHWATPAYIYKQVKEKGYFDPCPLHSEFNGLNISWNSPAFVNPPYSRLLVWVKKSIEENKKGVRVILLIPARTDTKVFKMIFEHGAIIEFIIGRLRFNEAGNAPFPSMLVTLTGDKKTICKLIEREEIKL